MKSKETLSLEFDILIPLKIAVNTEIVNDDICAKCWKMVVWVDRWELVKQSAAGEHRTMKGGLHTHHFLRVTEIITNYSPPLKYTIILVYTTQVNS